MYNKYLDTFIKVADTGSFTKAADKFLLSPTAVMKQINMLESDLKVKLFYRTHQGAVLTQSGHIIYDAAKKIIEFSNKENEKAKIIEGKENYTITIGTSMVCPCKPLIDIWYKISNDHPEYKIKIVPFEENHTNTLISLKSDNTSFDCIVTPCDSPSWLNNVNFLELGKTYFCINVPINHRLANKSSVSIKDLDNETIMIASNGDSNSMNKLRNKIISECPNAKIESTPFFYDINVFNKCADEGNILISLEFWDNIHPLLKNIHLDVDEKIPYGIIYKKNPNKELNNFIKLIDKNK